jgi:glycosyltransferase involved in cell wall biosynthesis
MMKASKIDSEIIITDELEDVREYLKRARVFIAPIRLGGGFRGKILEAMSMGIPIVATSIASEGLTASNNENIMIAGDPENFVENITLLFRDEKKYKFFSENSRRIVEENYSYKKVVEKLENVIKKVVQQSTLDK